MHTMLDSCLIMYVGCDATKRLMKKIYDLTVCFKGGGASHYIFAIF